MNRLPLSVPAACLMRSRALDTPTRLCVRSALCGPPFPLACRLPSTPSADVVRFPLGAAGFAWLSPAFPPSCPFISAIALRFRLLHPCSGASQVLSSSQTPCSVHRWLQSLDFPPRPTAPSAVGGTQGLPVLAHDASTHARGLNFDRARPRLASPCRRGGSCLRSRGGSRHLEVELDFAARYPACVCPCQRFGHVLADVST